jgi:hypothetical protein
MDIEMDMTTNRDMETDTDIGRDMYTDRDTNMDLYADNGKDIPVRGYTADEMIIFLQDRVCQL